jgi:hypothetical protein
LLASAQKDALYSNIAMPGQGCQMVYFQTKNPNLGEFWRASEWEMLV